MLGLEPDRRQRQLTISPALPGILRHLELKGVRAFGKRVDISGTGEHAEVAEAAPRGDEKLPGEKTDLILAGGAADAGG